MKLGLSMWSYVQPWKQGALDIPAFIREAARLEVDGVELLDYFWRAKASELDAAQSALRETGLPVGVYSVSNNFALPGEDNRRRQLKLITDGVDTAGELGASVVRVFAGDLTPGGGTPDDAMLWIVQGLTEAAAYAQAHGVTLALENHGALAGRSSQVGLILDAVNSPALLANPDTGNFLLMRDVPEHAVARLAPRAAMCHFKDFVAVPPNYEGFAYLAPDGTKYAGTALGEGEVSLADCLAALRAAAFDGWLNIEYESQEDPFTGVARSVTHARELLAAH